MHQTLISGPGAGETSSTAHNALLGVKFNNFTRYPKSPHSSTFRQPYSCPTRKRFDIGMPSASHKITRLTPAWPTMEDSPVRVAQNLLDRSQHSRTTVLETSPAALPGCATPRIC